MSTADDRLNVVEENYEDALEGEPHDLASAKTPEQVTAIQANLSAAKATYYAAVAAELAATSAQAEAAYTAAQAAAAAVKKARKDGELIPTLLSKLAARTSTAKTLVDVAKSV